MSAVSDLSKAPAGEALPLSTSHAHAPPRKPPPLQTAPWLSRVFFTWIGAIMAVARKKKTLEDADLYDLDEGNTSGVCVRRFEEAEKEWMDSKKGKEQGYKVFRVLFLAFKSDILLGGCLRFLNTCVQMPPFFFLQWYLQSISNPGSPPLTIASAGFVWVALIFTCQILKAVLESNYLWVGALTGMRMRIALQAAVFRKAVRLSQRDRAKFSTGEIVNLMQLYSQRIEIFAMMGHALWDGLVQILGYTGVAVYLIGWPTVVGLGVIILLLPAQAILMKKLIGFKIGSAKFTDHRVRLVTEILTGIKIVKMGAWEPKFAEAAGNVRAEEVGQLEKGVVLQGLSRSLLLTAPQMILLAVFSLYSLVLQERMTPDRVFATVAVFGQLMPALVIYPFVLSQYLDLRVATRALDRFLGGKERAEYLQTDKGGQAGGVQKGELELRKASFGWEVPPPQQPTGGPSKAATKTGAQMGSKGGQTGGEKAKKKGKGGKGKEEEKPLLEEKQPPLFKEIDLKIKKGELVGVVGPVGSGKSTLCAALLGEVDWYGGEAHAGGKVAFAAQTPWILNGTLKENILFGNQFDKKRYDEVLQVCELARDLEQLPDGDATEIGEKGVNLSGGQKQRVSLARAVYSEADVYVLDDPLSALDAEVGKSVFSKCIDGFLRGRTRILVTHHLHVISSSDTIVWLGATRLVAGGGESSMSPRKGEETDAGASPSASKSMRGGGAREAEILGVGTYEELLKNAEFAELLRTVESEKEEQKKSEREQKDEEKVRSRKASSAALSRGVSTEMKNLQEQQQIADIRRHSRESIQEALNQIEQIGTQRANEESAAALALQRISRQTAGDAAMEIRSSLPVSPGTKLDSALEKMDALPPENVRGVSAATEKKSEVPEGKEKKGMEGTEKEKETEKKPLVLMTTEEKAQGAVALSVYWDYVSGGRARGLFFALAGAQLLVSLSGLFANFWLALWTDASLPLEAWVYIVVYAGIGLHSAAWGFISGVQVVMFCAKASRQLHSKMLTSVLRAPSSFFDTTPLGRVIARFSRDTDQMDRQLPENLRGLLFTAFTVFAGVIGMSISVPLFLAVLPLIVVLYLWLMRMYISSLREMKRLDSVSRSPLYAHFQQCLNGLPTIRAYRQVKRFVDKADLQADGNTRAFFLLKASERWLQIRLEAIAGLTFASVACLALAMNVEAGLAGVAAVQALPLTLLLGFMVRSAAEVEASMNSVERILFYTYRIPQEAPFFSGCPGDNEGDEASRLFFQSDKEVAVGRRKALKEDAEREARGGKEGGCCSCGGKDGKEEEGQGRRTSAVDISQVKPPPRGWPFAGKVNFEGVKLRYREETPLVLEGLSFSVKAGEKIGVIGRTGSGKSTTLQALMRLVEYEGGKVEVDNVELQSIGLQDVRGALAVIPQDPVIFSGSVRFNLDPFDEHKEEALWEALRLVGLEEEIAGRCDTDSDLSTAPVSEFGDNFSVGQRQLLCIARATLRRAKIVLLDEATASIDTATDAKIQQVLKKAFLGCSMVVIAHRLRTIIDADRILALDAGTLMEYDSPHALLQKDDGLFRSLVEELGPLEEAALRKEAALHSEQKERSQTAAVDVLVTE
uniref:Uncharacterized protein n=1 Tax=Chromera velia CCMP2878 TaxID=1169474 RepID=A0A0G4HMQ0_9ALVE|eukprot:Cvel_7525.t1-p1 / transcript=Cvel_7525.t1 / gene=Cvel_7525 / organism=Chromera_velia_CCMP2878 / gene_product=ABC transporter C family member 1, putative / transcript_product=ABC transporter C family member 1, putative / location=Cvel_scaffold395:56936-68436(-) / protein_length=1597 / sequence_SO=supercontig / SO=protein_coding / is_pseudo=false